MFLGGRAQSAENGKERGEGDSGYTTSGGGGGQQAGGSSNGAQQAGYNTKYQQHQHIINQTKNRLFRSMSKGRNRDKYSTNNAVATPAAPTDQYTTHYTKYESPTAPNNNNNAPKVTFGSFSQNHATISSSGMKALRDLGYS